MAYAARDDQSPIALGSLSYGSHGEDPVIVTPCDRGGSRTGAVTMDDVAFACRCAFSWRGEIVTKTSASGRISLRSLRQVATFGRRSLLRYPAAGDRVTRSWDGATFEVVDVSAQGAVIACGLREIGARMQ